ncbi:glycoside hydrolase family 79 protein [Zopfia rhizophila CBS 207.26]|uniref:Glycoside hydrolase family 79 protein n=1 Tax=Zopfia rhizophila CBS 207.26 TaxID=1314779 RepID=A0A6A6DC19_9PEZI|nr:glycoside hydrolase family 79 protein [Zopfia rhizophila CBS 207.26]
MAPTQLRYLPFLGLIPSTLATVLPRASCSNSITLPGEVPEGASQNVDPNFPGFAFEQASWVPYAQSNSGKPNEFSKNLMNAITCRTGGKPIIRLGGTSADYAKYLPKQKEAAIPRAEDLTKNFPDASYIVQVPLATTNVSETVEWAKAAVQRIGKDKIQAIEVGNEADLYGKLGNSKLGPPEFQGVMTNETYVGNFTKYAEEILKNVELPSGPIFQALDTSAHLSRPDGYIFDVGGGAPELGPGLMTHSKISSRLDLYKPFIEYLQKSHPTIPFTISEVGNSLNKGHNYDYQAVLGSALWQVDFQLYGLSIGIKRFNWQQIMHAGYDMWLPVESAGTKPKVFSNFYAQPFVADFIGNTSGKTRVVYLPIEGSKDNVVAYAAYVGGSAARVAIVNLNLWDGGNGGERPSTKISFKVPGGVDGVEVVKLSSPKGARASADSITYAGSQWTYESFGKEVKNVRNDTEILEVKEGCVNVEVKNIYILYLLNLFL